MFEHKQGKIEGFTRQYEVDRLLHWESFDDVHKAIAREKQLKGWRREKRIVLFEKMNPEWEDLSRGWYGDRGPSRLAWAKIRPRFAQDDNR